MHYISNMRDNMLPLVSVVMSTYNRAGMVLQAVESILNQTMPDFEFIIINDKSDDNTYEILKNITDNRILLLNNNIRCGCTFNYHIANNLAKGKYIAHIDDDDISLKNRLEKQVLYMDKNQDTALSGTFIETFGENARPSWVFYTDPQKIDFAMNFYNPICHSSVIFRKDFVNKNSINYDITKKCAQDYDFYKQILINGGNMANIDEISVRYRMHKNRITDIKDTQQIQIFHAENVRKELLSRFFEPDKIKEIFSLTEGFPFNEYNAENVIEAIDIISAAYKKNGKDYDIIAEKIKNDIKNNLYRI